MSSASGHHSRFVGPRAPPVNGHLPALSSVFASMLLSTRVPAFPVRYTRIIKALKVIALHGRNDKDVVRRNVPLIGNFAQPAMGSASMGSVCRFSSCREIFGRGQQLPVFILVQGVSTTVAWVRARGKGAEEL